jgi:hypothetical protein
LKIPPGVTVVHADAGDGVVDPLSLSLAQPGDGLYFHLAVEGGKQLTENIPPHRIFDTIGKFVNKSATKIVIVNLSDIKPVPIGTAAAMAFLWDPKPMMALPPAQAEQAFLSTWLAKQYGAAAGSTLLPIVSSYFNMPYLTAQTNGKWAGEGDFASKLRVLANEFTAHIDPSLFPPGFPTPSGSPCALPVADAATAAGMAHGAGVVGATYHAALEAVATIPVHRQQFFLSHTVTQLAIWHYTAAALGNTSAAVFAYGKKDLPTAIAQASAALAQVEALLAAERAGEAGGGVWAGWHLNDWLDGYSNLRDVLRRLVSVLNNAPTTHTTDVTIAPPNSAARDARAHTTPVQVRPFRFGTGSWNSFFQYETEPVKSNGDALFPFFYQQQAETFGSFANAVRFACGPSSNVLVNNISSSSGGSVGDSAGEDVGACCTNTVIGGNFNCDGAVVVLAAVSPLAGGVGAEIRYNLANGTAAPAPTHTTGTVYTAGHPIALGAAAGGCNPCSIAAQLFTAAGVGLEPITRATYNRTKH